MSTTVSTINGGSPVSEATALMHMIERVARDPSVDITRLTQLMELRERIKASEAETAFDQAMNAVQSEMRPIATDCNNPQTRSRYASYAQLDRALRPIYSKHGFALSFDTEPADDNMVLVKCRVSHSGCSRPYQIPMPADGKGARGNDVMTRTHATGSAVSYGMRYLLRMIFNISVGESDDDGNAAGSAPRDNPHVVHASDIVDVPAADDPDRVPTPPYPGVRELPKMEQRPIAKKLGEELAWFDSLEDLTRWKNMPETAQRLATIRHEWREVFQGKLKERLLELRTAPKAPDAPPTDPEGMLGWIDGILAAAKDKAALEAAWNSRIETMYGQMFPSDQTEAMALYHKHEARVS